ncbi:hypothetical protein Hanom_Chr07g00678751 [Helianthus anomalus]
MVGVLVGEGKPINEQVTLVWDNKKFKVWIAEETSDWIPDFLVVKNDDYVGESIEGVGVGSSRANSSPINVNVGSQAENIKSQEVEGVCMHDNPNQFNAVEFPRWEVGWEKGTLNEDQLSNGGSFKSGVHKTHNKLGHGKGGPRLNKKAHSFFFLMDRT